MSIVPRQNTPKGNEAAVQENKYTITRLLLACLTNL
jgi:hypothetical protein